MSADDPNTPVKIRFMTKDGQADWTEFGTVLMPFLPRAGDVVQFGGQDVVKGRRVLTVSHVIKGEGYDHTAVFLGDYTDIGFEH